MFRLFHFMHIHTDIFVFFPDLTTPPSEMASGIPNKNIWLYGPGPFKRAASGPGKFES